MDRPNLVLFMPDQLRADAVGCFGNPVAKTPHIDALAARGTRFANAFVNHPVCGPSRVNLMTGWYPHTRGHRTLTHLVKPWEPNLLAYLRSAGYHVALAGNRGDTFAPGVTEASTDFCGFLTKPEHLFSKPAHPPGSKLYSAFYNGKRPGPGVALDFDEAAVRTAEEWLAGGPPEPWVLFLPLIFPHLPFEVEDPWYSLHQAGDMPAPIPADPNAGKPLFQQAIRDRYGLERLDGEDWAEIARTYYGMVSRVDSQLGRVMDAVDSMGAAPRTAWFFFTDHGEYLGDFGLVEKWPAALDPCITRNPLVVALPGGPQGQVAKSFVETVDLLPSLLEIAGGEISHTHFGKSFVPLLHDAAQPHRDAAFTEGGFRTGDVDLFEQVIQGPYEAKSALQRERPETVGKAIAMRTEDYTYVYRLYEDDELYDRREDPTESHNLLVQPGFEAIASELRDRVLQWLFETSDVIPWDKDPRFPPVPNGYREN